MFKWLKEQIDDLVGDGGKKKHLTSNYKNTISINDIDIPIYISSIQVEDLRNMVKGYVKTYKALEYYKAQENSDLREKEWNSYELAVMFYFLRMNLDLLSPNIEKIFPQYMLNMDKQALKKEIDILMVRYKQHVKAEAKESILKADKNWNAHEIGCLLYYFHIYERE